MRYKTIKCLIFFIIILSIVLIPFILQWALLNETIFPFNLSISFSRETWFGFIASYLGAIGTIILGIIAIWQNKRYKELADKSSQESELIQQEVKGLSKKTMEAIEALKRIELAKYYPSIEKMPCYYHGITKEYFMEQFESEEYTIQSNFISLKDCNDVILPISELVDKYNTYLFIVKNVGEKAIRKFNCNQLLINGIQPNFVVNNECDILPGKYAVIAVLNFPEFKKNEIIELKMRFVFKNLVMENYYIEIEIIITFDEETPSSHVISFTFPEIYKDNE